ncbi:FlgD immunoglobulin-like domain containing protein [Mumia qirimensis]|uniref:FlgD immunoglobulin-like domain containing protein n=1 Tax=Mumia qirimensis TaxID=3234852 RepID=UPI00351CC546
MRRALVPALAVALLPFGAVSPAEAGTASPNVVKPGGSATLTFTLPDAIPSGVVEVRPAGRSEVVVSLPLIDLPAGDVSAVWDGRATGGALVADGAYTASIRAAVDGSAPVDSATVRANFVAPRAAAAPSASAGTVFPYVDGYGDAVTLTGPAPTSEVTSTSSLQVLNGAGAVVWSSAARSARWTGRTTAGAILPKGTYRARSRFVDTDGLVGYSPARNVAVSAKRLVTVTENVTVSPHAFLWRSYVGKCGKIVKPARKGKAWRRSLAVSSNHRCTSKGRRSITEAYFAGRGTGVHDYRSFTVKAVGGGHTKARKNSALGFGVTAAWDDISKTRRLSPKFGTRTVFSASGSALRRYVDREGWITWTIGTAYTGRYDVKAFRIRTAYRVLVDPTARRARVAPTAGFQAHG